MSDNITFDSARQRTQCAGATHSSLSENPFNSGIDAIVLAFYFLMEASATTTQSATVHAKQLNQNALAQEQLNKKGEQLQWYYVPKLKVDHHTVRETHRNWTWRFWKHGGFRYWTYKYVKWTTNPNGALVNNAEAHNQQIAAERQTIADRLNVLQQGAQIGETNINTCTNESMQAMQEGENLLEILQNLTFKALMRQPPQ